MQTWTHLRSDVSERQILRHIRQRPALRRRDIQEPPVWL
jgi:hypothetical protein